MFLIKILIKTIVGKILIKHKKYVGMLNNQASLQI